MPKEFIDVFNICFILFIGWIIFTFLAFHRLNYIKNYKRISLLFLSGTVILFSLYFNYLKSFFTIFSFTPFILLLVFYYCLFLVYKILKQHINFTIVEKLEVKKVYFASISNRYIVYKSFDILFQQIAILCVLFFLRNLHLPYLLLIVLFATSFAISHVFMLKRGVTIGILFITSALFGGITFPLLLNLQYGIVYTFMLHWMFYLALGVLTHIGPKLYPRLNVAL